MPQLGYHLPRETTERCWVNCVKLGILHNSQDDSQHTHATTDIYHLTMTIVASTCTLKQLSHRWLISVKPIARR